MQLIYLQIIIFIICYSVIVSQAQVENGDADYTINYEDYLETTTPYPTTTTPPPTTKRKPRPRPPPKKTQSPISVTTHPPIRIITEHRPETPDENIVHTRKEIEILPPTASKVEVEETKPKKPVVPWYKCEKPERYSSKSSSYNSYFITGSDHCSGECPHFSVICRSKYYEVRKYPETTWAQTLIRGFSYKWALRQAFQRVFKYFNRGNSNDVKMGNTSPILVQVREVASHDSPIKVSVKKKDYNFFFYIPAAYHWYTPSPKDRRIHIQKLQPQSVFALVLEELKTEAKIARAAEKFKQQLAYYNEDYIDEYFFVNFDKAGATTHHSEIWVPMRYDATASCEKKDQGYDYENNILEGFDSSISTSKWKSTGPQNLTEHVQNGDTTNFEGGKGSSHGSLLRTNITYRYIMKNGKRIRVEDDYDINIPGVRTFDSNRGPIQKILQKVKLVKPTANITKVVTVPRPTRPTIKIVKIERSGEAVDIRENDIVFEKGVRIIKTTKDKLSEIGSGIKKIITSKYGSGSDVKIIDGKESEIEIHTGSGGQRGTIRTEHVIGDRTQTGSGNQRETHIVTGSGLRGDTGGRGESHAVTESLNEVHPTSPEEQASLLAKLNICSGGKCPLLSVLEFHRLGIQKRNYQNAYFLIASPDTCGYENSLKKGSEMLTSYISGNNARDENIDLKSPSLIILRVSSQPANNEDCENKFDVLYYLPESLQINPPWPSDPKVSLRGIKDMNVYSHSMVGPVTERTIEREQRGLERKLRTVGKCALPNEYFVTTYFASGSDSVKSELWMLADETCQAAFQTQRSPANLRTFSACSGRGIDCPWFDQIELHKSYEGRGYSPAQYWLTTDIKACHIDDARNLGFMRLFQYFMGENEFRSRLVMTAPTILTMRPGRANTTGEQCEETFTMSVYLHSNAPAQPLNPRVYFKRIMGDVFVKVFNYTNDESIKTALYQLADELKEDGRCYDDDEIVLAEYDQPWVSRFHSEIWMFRRWCNEAEEYEAKRTDYYATVVDDLDFFDLDYATVSKFNLKHESQTDIKNGAAVADSCSKTQCAQYEIIQNYGAFVERNYSKAKWVCSRNFGCDIDSVSKRSHTQIFNYFYGDDNVKTESLKNTAPMITKMDLNEVNGADTSCNHDYETCSIIPEDYQKAPPQPKAGSSLQIQSLENELFYVLPYGGYTHTARIKELVFQFKKMLDAKNLPYKNVAYSAIYDDTRRVWKRHNEIWIPRGKATETVVKVVEPVAPAPTISPVGSSTVVRWRKVLVTRRPKPRTTSRPVLPEYQ